jgi:hypothetical protein
MKLARTPLTKYWELQFPTSKSIEYVVKGKQRKRSVDTPPSPSGRAADCPVQIKQSNHQEHSKTETRVPDFNSLKRRNYERNNPQQLFTLERLCSQGGKTSSKKLEEICRTATPSSKLISISPLTPELFQTNEDRESAGRILLGHELLVACEYGRPKKLNVILFEKRLVFLRRAADHASVQYDIPVEYLLQVTHRFDKPGHVVLTVFWDAEPDGPHEVAGAEMFFDDMDQMRLWAGYLALVLVMES